MNNIQKQKYQVLFYWTAENAHLSGQIWNIRLALFFVWIISVDHKNINTMVVERQLLVTLITNNFNSLSIEAKSAHLQ